MSNNYNKLATLGLAAFAVVVSVGCSGPDPTSAFVEQRQKPMKDYVSQADAGVRIAPGDANKLLNDQAAAMTVATRSNPFSLLGVEAQFDREQFAAGHTASVGFFRQVGGSKVVESGQPTFRVESQPDRRLAGILIGESVSALIDMNDGNRDMRVIRPGSEIKGPGGEVLWIVVSIDEEKATLRRGPAYKDVRPQTVAVRLRHDREGGTTAPSGGGAGGGGEQGGGNRPPGKPGPGSGSGGRRGD